MKGDKEARDPLPGLADLDRVIHEPVRLLVLAYLYVVEAADLLFLVRQTGLTWGNLSAHVGRLEEAGYVQIEKEFLNRKPHTIVQVTNAGKEAFRRYRQQMKAVLDDLPD